MKVIIISGSSRKKGDTANIANKIANILHCDLIHLLDYNISYYDYDHKNSSDDFIPLIKKLINEYDTFIFITPVYWYSMSGIFKTFFDRITDLITIKKEIGRKLRGKNMAVVSSSSGDNLGELFWLPFSKSADYLGINYLDNAHTIVGKNNNNIINSFIKSLKKSD